jgi:hypothetical protein
VFRFFPPGLESAGTPAREATKSALGDLQSLEQDASFNAICLMIAAAIGPYLFFRFEEVALGIASVQALRNLKPGPHTRCAMLGDR